MKQSHNYNPGIIDIDYNINDLSDKDIVKCNEEIDASISEKLNIHEDICNNIHNLYVNKNRDYGDSMHPLFEEYGLTAFLVMFSIKINRIKTLMNKREAKYESLEDSLLDLANYALIAVTELRHKAKENKGE